MEENKTETTVQKKKTTYFFVRHGQTDWNVQGKLQGHTDIPLNDTGKQQAGLLKEILKDTHFFACFSSDLQRAAETASIVVAGRSLDVTKEGKLRDRNYGNFEGISFKEFEASKLEQCPSVENNGSLRKRIEGFLVDKSQEKIQGNILIVTHGGFISSVLSLVLDLPFAAKSTIRIDNTAYVQMYFSGSEWVVEKIVGITLPEIVDSKR